MLLAKDSNIEVYCINHCFFRLDGGAMFGVVPKKIWSRLISSDADNCIKMAARSLWIKDRDKQYLIDLGMGNKWTEKQRAIYNIQDLKHEFSEQTPTDIILTHLHLDHAGGISEFSSGELKLSYPNATIYIQKENYLNATTPNLRERGSYLEENVKILEQAKVTYLDGDSQISAQISSHQINGHTAGQQWLKVTLDHTVIAFPGDLIPTSAHIQPHYNMGYDICAKTLMQEKIAFLEAASEGGWLVIFQHDPAVIAAKIAYKAGQAASLLEQINDK
jgi:glyoxylase-like metal-dependent hydrolase (beta-lactamase superfamily II)